MPELAPDHIDDFIEKIVHFWELIASTNESIKASGAEFIDKAVALSIGTIVLSFGFLGSIVSAYREIVKQNIIFAVWGYLLLFLAVVLSACIRMALLNQRNVAQCSLLQFKKEILKIDACSKTHAEKVAAHKKLSENLDEFPLISNFPKLPIVIVSITYIAGFSLLLFFMYSILTSL